MRKHYHVMSGMPGCLPDNTGYCATRKDADDALRWERDSLIDCYRDDDGYRKSGSVASGLIVITIGDYGCQRYAERYECTDPTCTDADY